MRKKSRRLLARWIAVLLSKLPPESLDLVARDARDLQHREEDGWYRNRKEKWQQCRLVQDWSDDQIMQESGCWGEFVEDWRKRDIADGCSHCTGELAENASEPDVLARWGFRR